MSKPPAVAYETMVGVENLIDILPEQVPMPAEATSNPVERSRKPRLLRKKLGAVALALAMVGGTGAALLSEVVMPTLAYAETEPQGPLDFENSLIADKGIAEVGQTFPSGNDGDPGECMVSAQRWAIAANGGKDFFNYTQGVISVWTASGGAEVSLNQLKKGDILQLASKGNDWDSNWSKVHTIVFREYNQDGTIKIVDANREAEGKVGIHDSYPLTGPDGWGWRAFRFGKTNKFAGVGEGTTFRSSYGNIYTKAGGRAWWIAHENNWGPQQTEIWGPKPTGDIPPAEIDANEASWGAYPPLDQSALYEADDGIVRYFYDGRSFKIASTSEAASMGLSGRMYQVPAGALGYHNKEGNIILDSGQLYRYSDGPRVSQFMRESNGTLNSYIVSNNLMLDCFKIIRGQTPIAFPASARSYVDNGYVHVLNQSTNCSFPPYMVLNAPGDTSKWRIVGDGKYSNYTRQHYPNMYSIYLNSNGLPDFRTLSSSVSLNNAPQGASLAPPPHIFFRNSGTGNVYWWGDDSVAHRVTSMDSLSCMGGPSLVEVPSTAMVGVPEGNPAQCSLEGKLAKQPDGKVYYILNGQKRYVMNTAIMNGLMVRVSSTQNRLTDVSSSALNSYNTGPNAYVPYGPPVFVKYQGDSTVWLALRDGTRKHAYSVCTGVTIHTMPTGEFNGHISTGTWSANTPDCDKIRAGQDL